MLTFISQARKVKNCISIEEWVDKYLQKICEILYMHNTLSMQLIHMLSQMLKDMNSAQQFTNNRDDMHIMLDNIFNNFCYNIVNCMLFELSFN